jgi:methionyl-tRNA formyltransferase
MLPVEVLACARRGNMHGSLLPKYRGRVPINWAVLHGETETGATLHEMTVKPDAGAIVAQTSVPILPDDTAHEVFGKVVVAAERRCGTCCRRCWRARRRTCPTTCRGGYFSGRKPEDGRIDWRRTAGEVHNLVRAVAPPYPGAFEEIAGDKITVTRTRLVPPAAHPALQRAHGTQDKFFEGGKLYARCGDGNFLQILGIRSMIRMLPSTII